MEVERLEGCELGSVFCEDIVKAGVDGATEVGEVAVVTTLDRVMFDELPQAFDQIEVREEAFKASEH